MKIPIQCQPINRKVGSVKNAIGTNSLRSIRASIDDINPNLACNACLNVCLLLGIADPSRGARCTNFCYMFNC